MWVGTAQLSAQTLARIQPVRLIILIDIAQAEVSRLQKVEVTEHHVQQSLSSIVILYLVQQLSLVEQHHATGERARRGAQAVHHAGAAAAPGPARPLRDF